MNCSAPPRSAPCPPTPTHQGTTAIPAAELAGRQIARADGQAPAELVLEMLEMLEAGSRSPPAQGWQPWRRRSPEGAPILTMAGKSPPLDAMPSTDSRQRADC